MTASFLVDAQLPPALARLIAESGHDAVHVFDVELGSATDAEICKFAVEHGMAVVTKDEDFADRVNLAVASPTVVWVRLGNTRRERLLDWFAPQIERIAAMVDGDEKLIELR